MHMHTARTIQYQRTDRCNWVMEMLLRRRDVEIYQMLGEIKFGLYDRKYDILIKVLKKLK